jgi:hypothetical protein
MEPLTGTAWRDWAKATVTATTLASFIILFILLFLLVVVLLATGVTIAMPMPTQIQRV